MVHGFSESNIEMFYANGPEDKSFNKDDSIGKNDSNQDDSDSKQINIWYHITLRHQLGFTIAYIVFAFIPWRHRDFLSNVKKVVDVI